MTTIAKLVVSVTADAANFVAGLDNSIQKTNAFTEKVTRGASIVTAGIGVMAAAGGAAVVGLGYMAFNAAETMDEAYDIIQAGTGTTGDRLLELQSVFDSVFTSIPTDAALAASVITELEQRISGLDPSQLEEMSAQMLEMTRLTGGDAVQNVQLFTRVLGDWSVPLEQNTQLLDMLFKASQTTGAGIEDLMGNVVQFGSPMRLMGFDLQEAIALFAKWEQEGVNAELVMGSLRIAAGNFARDNVSLRDGLFQTMDAIKGAKDESAALAIAMDVFGARAGPDMAAAILEGRFNIEELIATLKDAEGGILETAKATEDWGEMWIRFKNGMTKNLAPIGESLRAVAGSFVDFVFGILGNSKVQEFIGNLASWLGKLADRIKIVIEAVSNNGLMAFFSVFEDGSSYIGSLLELFGMSEEKADSFALAIRNAVQSVVGGFSWLAQQFQTNQGLVVGALSAIAAAILITVVPAAISAVAAMLPIIAVMAAVGAVAYVLYQAWTQNWGGLRDTVMQIWQNLQPTFEALRQWLSVAIPAALQWLSNLWTGTLLPALQAVWNFLSTYIFPLFEAIGNVIMAVIVNSIKQWAAFIGNVLVPKLQELWQWIETNILPSLQRFAAWVSEKVSPALNGIGDAIQDVIGWLQGLAESISNLSLPDWLTPGSPTPWEIGLRGAGDALEELARKQLPSFSTELAMSATPVGAGNGQLAVGSGAGAGGNVFNINVASDGIMDERDVARKISAAVKVILREGGLA